MKNTSSGYVEILVWSAALLLFAFLPPSIDRQFSFCILRQLGFDHCPGCGLGHSISLFLAGDILASFNHHPFGGFAVIIILFRIFQLIRLKLLQALTITNTSAHEQCKPGIS